MSLLSLQSENNLSILILKSVQKLTGSQHSSLGSDVTRWLNKDYILQIN